MGSSIGGAVAINLLQVLEHEITDLIEQVKASSGEILSASVDLKLGEPNVHSAVFFEDFWLERDALNEPSDLLETKQYAEILLVPCDWNGLMADDSVREDITETFADIAKVQGINGRLTVTHAFVER
jgi:hypothetical protein